MNESHDYNDYNDNNNDNDDIVKFMENYCEHWNDLYFVIFSNLKHKSQKAKS
jgi:hypothetical protein